MISPFLFVGVGGSGQKTLRAIKAELHRTLMSKKEGKEFLGRYGFPAAWQFLSIDTPYVQDGQAFDAKGLDTNEYLGLVESGVELNALLARIRSIQTNELDKDKLEEILQPLPKHDEYRRAVDIGAGQLRAIGRTISVARMTEIIKRLRQAFAAMESANSGSQLKALGDVLKQSTGNRVNIVLISSLSGGSGSGQFLDVSEAIKGAKSDEAWVNEQTAVLYAPDVFSELASNNNPNKGIGPNSLHAVSELVNSRFRMKRTESQQFLFSKLGIQMQAQSMNTYSVGPKQIYLVGKSNGKTTFSSQNEVYHAVALSLARWAVDGALMEQINNYQINNEVYESDAARLRLDGEQIPAPLSSLGFARVSLGMDSFSEYAKGRLARAAVNRLVNKHIEDIEEGEKDIDAAKRKAEYLLAQFHEEAKFTTSNIVDMMMPPSVRNSLFSDLSNAIRNRAGAQNSQVATREHWRRGVEDGLLMEFPKFSREWVEKRTASLDSTATALQKHVMKVVMKYVSMYGLLVTAKILEIWSAKMEDAISKQPSITPSRESLFQKLKDDVSKIFTRDSSGSIKYENPEVANAFNVVSEGSKDYMSSDDLVVARRLQKDAIDNFLLPLATELGQRYDVMKKATLNDNYKGTGKNMFTSWPKEGTVPNNPSENVRMLVKPAEFERLFESLLMKSVNADSPGHAMEKAVQELIQGSESIEELKNIDPRNPVNAERIWHPMIEVKTSRLTTIDWTPPGVGRNQSRWSGQFEGDLEDWETMAERYIYIDGRPLEKELRKSLYDWLTPSNDSERLANEDIFYAEFASALASCQPFAKVDSNLFSQVTNGEVLSPSISIGRIPVDLENSKSTLGNRLLQLIFETGKDAEEIKKLFVGESSNDSVVEFFSNFSRKAHFFLFDNLMQPIIDQWSAAKDIDASRKDFMKFRTGRPLAERIPASPRTIEQMIRGWYVAKMLNLDSTPNSKHRYSPAYEIWDVQPGRNSYVQFPNPLYYSGSRIDPLEEPAAILDSLSIALVDCSNQRSLAPLRPYHVLLDLGGLDIQASHPLQTPTPSEVLRNWLSRGMYSDSDLAPVPTIAIAGSPEMTSLERCDLAIKYFEQEKERFRKTIVDTGAGKEHPEYVWQIRREVESALSNLILMVEYIRSNY